MKKISKLFLFIILNSTMFCLFGVVYADPGEKSEETSDKKYYNLNIDYNNWIDEETQPFDYISKGEKCIQSGSDVKIPMIGSKSKITKDGNRKEVIAIGFSTAGDEYRSLMSRVNSRFTSFEMPSCDVRMWIVFNKN